MSRLAKVKTSSSRSSSSSSHKYSEKYFVMIIINNLKCHNYQATLGRPI